MHYEEIQNADGEFYFRITPEGGWTKFSYEQLQRKCNDLCGRVANAYAALTETTDDNA